MIVYNTLNVVDESSYFFFKHATIYDIVISHPLYKAIWLWSCNHITWKECRFTFSFGFLRNIYSLEDRTICIVQIRICKAQQSVSRSGLYGGQKCFFSCIILGTVFLYSIQPISTWNDKILDLGSKKKVCSALLWHYAFFLWWEWIWVKNPLRTSFSDMLLWFYCLIMYKWAQNA